MTAGTRIMLLGDPRIAHEPPAAKTAALLAYLALSSGPQPRERIVGLLWGESGEAAARKNLRNTLWAIRRALGDEALISQGDRLALRPGLPVDVWRFEALARAAAPRVMAVESLPDRVAELREALALYRGPLLDGVGLGQAPELEIWLAGERERLHQLALRSTEELIGLLRAELRWAELRDAALRGLQLDPLHEALYQALIEAHGRLGERADALRHYEQLRATLEQELGVAPLPETEALRAAILQGDLRPLPPSPPRPRAAAVMGQPGAPFVGRAAELALLDQALAAAMAGQARAVTLSGELGIGKTRLWRFWAGRLPADLHVLEAACHDGTQGLPLQPLVELFRSQACAARLFHPGSPVAPIWLAEVARLLPELREAIPGLPPPAALPPDEERRHLFEAFVQCLRALGGPGLVLFVDDVHWAGQATLDWLSYLLRRMADRPLLLVAGARTEAQPAALNQLIARWAREGLLSRLELGRLSQAELADLVGPAEGPGARRALEQSGGNPYFALELLRSPGEGMPPALADLVRDRLERLPEQARQVAQAAAVLGGTPTYGALRRTSGRAEEETLDALDALLGAALLVEREGRYHFAHPLVGAVLRDALSQARRAFLHRRAGEALEAENAGRLGPVAGLLVEHFAQAGDAGRAARYAELAAEHALALASPGQAASYYEQALAVEPTAERWLGLGRARERQGDLAGARQALGRALAAAGAGQAARFELELAYSYLSSADGPTVVELARRVAGRLGPDAPPQQRAFAAFLIGAGLLQSPGDPGEAEQQLDLAARLATEHSLPTIAARSRFEQGNLLARRGAIAAARAAFQRAVDLARAAGDLFQEALGQNNAAYHALLDGDLRAAREHLAAGLALAEQHALELPLQWLWSTSGELALAEGDRAAAVDAFTRGLALAEAQGNQAMVARYHENLALADPARGDPAAAWAAAASSRRGFLE